MNRAWTGLNSERMLDFSGPHQSLMFEILLNMIN